MQGFNHYFENQSKLLIKKVNKLHDRSQRQFIFRTVVLTIYGFQVAIPVVLGVLLGTILDKHFPINHISWTLNLILLGVFIGFYNANIWFCRMISLKNNKKGAKK